MSGKVFVLVGRESWRPAYLASNTWCDFGGGIVGRKPPDCTARDELREETLGCVVLPSSWRRAHTQGGRCVAKIVSDEGQLHPYWMYLVLIPFGNIPRAFRTRREVAGTCSRRPRTVSSRRVDREQREALRQILPHAFKRSGILKDKFLEKDELRWIELNALRSWVLGTPPAQGQVLRTEFRSALCKCMGVFDTLSRMESTRTGG